MAAAAKWDIVRGFSTIRFGPWEPVNRAVVTMVIRALHNWSGITLEKPTSDSDYYKRGIFAGFDDPFHGLNMQIAEYNGLLNSIWLDHDGRWDPWLRRVELRWRRSGQLPAVPGLTAARPRVRPEGFDLLPYLVNTCRG